MQRQTTRQARRRPLFHVLSALLLAAVLVPAMPVPAAAQQSLTVGTKVAPPFVMQDEGSGWRGLSIDLWERLAELEGIAFTFEERTLDGMLSGVSSGELDAAIAAITVTGEREERVDFTHPFYESGLGIAVEPRESGGWLATASRFFSIEFLLALGALALVLFASGALVWFFERRHNDEFRSDTRGGLWDGFWWSAVTMTTVGYGDKAPRSLAGKIVSLVWMFTSVIVISSFTASIASSLTVEKLGGVVNGVDDLPKARVAAVSGATGAAYLERENIGFRGVPDLDSALQSLARGEVDAVVHDAPLLRFRARNELSERVEVLAATFDRQDYAIALPPGSDLREPLNRRLIEIVRSDWWADRVERYLGTPE